MRVVILSCDATKKTKNRPVIFSRGMTDWETLYVSVIEKTIENVLKAPGSTAIRRDVIDSIKRRWITALTEVEDSGRGGKRHVTDSDPSTVDRSKYTIHKPSNEVELPPVSPTPLPEAESEDEFADEFGESEFVHATAVGKKLAESAKSVVENKSEPKKIVLASAGSEKKLVILNAEELDESLADPEYDKIPEPVDCGIRVFGQTEVCESIVGPRRSDSRWMVTIMNGFVRSGGESGEEIPFRTANQTMSHFHQF